MERSAFIPENEIIYRAEDWPLHLLPVLTLPYGPLAALYATNAFPHDGV